MRVSFTVRCPTHSCPDPVAGRQSTKLQSVASSVTQTAVHHIDIIDLESTERATFPRRRRRFRRVLPTSPLAYPRGSPQHTMRPESL
jgi:hypothetical protein